jgi:hypothetical protein
VGGGGGFFEDWWRSFQSGVSLNTLDRLLWAAMSFATHNVYITIGGTRYSFEGRPGANFQGVSPYVLAEVFVAAVSTPGVTSLYLFSGWRPSGDGTGGLLKGEAVCTHCRSWAVDISRVNGAPVLNHPDFGLISAFQAMLERNAYAAEVYGPAGVLHRRDGPSSAWTIADSNTQQHHLNHIHYSSWSPWFK